MKKLGEHLDLPQTSQANPVKWHSTHNKNVAHVSIEIQIDIVQVSSLGNHAQKRWHILIIFVFYFSSSLFVYMLHGERRMSL